jgi:hypothetical protein
MGGYEGVIARLVVLLCYLTPSSLVFRMGGYEGVDARLVVVLCYLTPSSLVGFV